MTEAEWESLCDGCGRCCLIKTITDDTNETFYLDVACSLLDTDTCRCTDYTHKVERNVGCFHLTPAMIPHLDWMPPTCGYRLVSQGKDLEWWHPLISGDPETVRQSGVSIAGRAIPRMKASVLEYHTVDWPRDVLPDNPRRAWTLAMFGGINASVPTPFGAGGRVDLDLMAEHCFWLLANGCQGLTVLDKAGEVASLAIEERIALIEGLVLRGVPPSKLLAGIGPASAADGIRIAARADDLGVRGVLLAVSASDKTVPRDILPDALIATIEGIPSRQHVYLSLSVSPAARAACLTALDAFMQRKPERLKGIRDEALGCPIGLAVLDRYPGSRFEVYTGDETALASLVERGGAGLMGPGANLLSPLCAEILQPTRPELGAKIRQALDAASAVLRSCPTVPAIKTLLARHGGKPEWERVRLPLRPPNPDDRAELFRAFDASGVKLRPVMPSGDVRP
jgi:uncharacterized cysteine cluster protein YcgN (CxxCxxCC family)/dihydrodipicolinate synthase/N-acetylneuraminate lyase